MRKSTSDQFTLGVYFEKDRLFVDAHFEVSSVAEAKEMIDLGMSLYPEGDTLWLWVSNVRSRELLLYGDDGFPGDHACGQWLKRADRRSHECYLDALLPPHEFWALCGSSLNACRFNLVRYEYNRKGQLKEFHLLALGDIYTPAPDRRYSGLHQRTG